MSLEWLAMNGGGGSVAIILMLVIDTPVRDRISGLEAPFVGLALTTLFGWITFKLVFANMAPETEDFWLYMCINAALFGTALWSLWGTFRLALQLRPRASLL